MVLPHDEGANIPSIPGLPLVGSAIDFKRNTLGFFLNAASKHGDICSFRIGPMRAVFLNNAEYVSSVWLDPGRNLFSHRPAREGTIAPLIGKGMIYQEGEPHRRHRKALNPFFQPRSTAQYADDIVTATEEFQSQWSDGVRIELFQSMKDLALAILRKTLFRHQPSTEVADLSSRLDSFFRYLIIERSRVLGVPKFLYPQRYAAIAKKLADLRSIGTAWIERARAASTAENDRLLMLLMGIKDELSGDGLTTEQIRDDIHTLILGGYETTANLFSWAIYSLMRHTSAYSRLQAEVDASLGGRAPSDSDLERLPYNHQIIKETLRLYPSVPVLTRWSVGETVAGGYRIPSSTKLFISPYVLHRRPDYFPDPAAFRPERFAPGMENSAPRFSYIPFGLGPRVCLGAAFAHLESQLALATMTQRVTFELTSDERAEPDSSALTLRPRRGIWVRVRRRGARR